MMRVAGFNVLNSQGYRCHVSVSTADGVEVRADRQAELAALIPDPRPNGPSTAPATHCFTAAVCYSGFLLAAWTCPLVSSTPYVSLLFFFSFFL